jgi:hypothetical protein
MDLTISHRSQSRAMLQATSLNDASGAATLLLEVLT